MNHGAPDEFSSDGGPQFTLTAFTEFLLTWGVSHHLSSVSYLQSNSKAEAAVKTIKHIIQENTACNGSLNTDRVAKAIMPSKPPTWYATESCPDTLPQKTM